MKKTLFVALMVITGIAHAEDISVAAGRCGAYMMVKNDLTKARLAINNAENKGKMQVAANNWIDLAKTDPKSAAQQGAWSCVYTLGIKME